MHYTLNNGTERVWPVIGQNLLLRLENCGREEIRSEEEGKERGDRMKGNKRGERRKGEEMGREETRGKRGEKGIERR